MTLQPHEWQIIALADGPELDSGHGGHHRDEDFAFMQTVAPLVTGGLLEMEVVAKVPPMQGDGGRAVLAGAHGRGGCGHGAAGGDHHR